MDGMLMFLLHLTIVMDVEEKEEDQVKRNLQATLTTLPLAKKEAGQDSMAKKSKLIKKHHNQWCWDNGYSYHYKLGKMISKVKAETKWRDIFRIVEEAQGKLRRER